MAWRAITDEEWKMIAPVIPKQKRGRPRGRDRELLDAILYKLHTGIRWEEIPPGFPPKMTVYDRFRAWHKAGFFKKLFERLQRLRPRTGQVYYLDSTVKTAKRGPSNFESRKNKRQQNQPGDR